MERPDFGRPATHPAPPVTHAIHDDDANVFDGDIAEAVHDGLPAKAVVEPKPSLPFGCRWRVPLTRVHNPSGVLLLYRDQLDAQTLDQVMVYIKVDGSIDTPPLLTSGRCAGHSTEFPSHYL